MTAPSGKKLTAKERLQAGLWYDANFDADLLAARMQCDRLCHEFNTLAPTQSEARLELLNTLLKHVGKGVTVLGPLYCDYGYNVSLGEGTFVNHNAYFMDCAPITLGKHCFIGPGCGFYTASHPLLFAERNTGLEKASPITIEDNVWLGGNVVLLPGVTIHEGAVVGAGAVVTRDVPALSLVVGNPARVLRKLGPEDSILKESRGML